MSLIGRKIEGFSVQAFVDGDFKKISCDDLKGSWSVFVFYPADFTFVCPTELGDLADRYEDFKQAGCEVYSVSTDTHFTHKAWHDASETIKKIKFPMLADPTHKLSQLFEVLIPEEGLALRGSFVLNPEGEIVAYEVNSLGIGRDAGELLRKVQAAQFVAQNGDQVCPAKWK
ncbi:MAG: alkyl hydroperoxide reductase subunit C, partial [Defluviitaleaceae bacterium]|nr:alkyl hydroperoxide reductase subunit C [Defluviitaleaceae bacterium]